MFVWQNVPNEVVTRRISVATDLSSCSNRRVPTALLHRKASAPKVQKHKEQMRGTTWKARIGSLQSAGSTSDPKGTNAHMQSICPNAAYTTLTIVPVSNRSPVYLMPGYFEQIQFTQTIIRVPKKEALYTLPRGSHVAPLWVMYSNP